MCAKVFSKNFKDIRLKSLKYIKNNGLNSFFLWVLRQWFYPYFRVNIEYQLSFNIADVALVSKKIKSRIPLEIVLINLENLNKFKEISDFQNIILNDFKERMIRGDIGFIAVHEGMPIGYIWLGFIKAHILGLNCDIILQQNEAYIYNVFVLDEYRGNRVNLELLLAIMDNFKHTNISKLLELVRIDNFSNLRSLKKIGYKKEKIYIYLEFFKKKIALITLRPFILFKN